MRTAISSLLLNNPCSSKFAAAVHAGTLPRRYPSSTPPPISRRQFQTSTRAQEINAAQPRTSAADNIDLTEPVAYISESNDPWFNLSYEDWLLRNTSHNQPVLFLYRNRPCVVIGRNQNPWQESTPRQLKEWDIPLIRRRSGGGTVFHDMGNTNFSIILPRLLFTRSHGAELVSRAIRDRLGIQQCTVNNRNDVIIRDGQKDFKVSGSAYKIIQHRAYHHGTMLISSSLDDLGKSLKSSSPNIKGKSVASFRSPVTTLNSYLPSRSRPLTHESFTDAVVAEFSKVYQTGSDGIRPKVVSEDGTRGSEAGYEKIWKGVEELKSWEWTYGQTPEFENTLEGELSFGKVAAHLAARHAIIQTASLRLAPSKGADSANQDTLDGLQGSLLGKRYASLGGVEGEIKQSPVVDETLAWLRANL